MVSPVPKEKARLVAADGPADAGSMRGEAGDPILTRRSSSVTPPKGDFPDGMGYPADSFGEVAEWLKAAPC